MDTARRPTMLPTALLLRRWLCGWLALLMALQMLGSTLAGLQTSWHRHRPALQASAAPSTPLVRWRHGEASVAAEVDTHAQSHAQLHARGEVHEHALTDTSVLPWGIDAAGDAVAQLAAVLAPGAGALTSPRCHAHHVRAMGERWAATSRSIAPLLQPPRA